MVLRQLSIHRFKAGCRVSNVKVTPVAASVRTMHSIQASYYRGGTSRALVFNQQDLPKDRDAWAPIFRGCLGSPDPNGRQLDGMGSGVSSLSKICVVGPSSIAEADVDYTFVGVGIKDSDVDYSSNCGNMTSAIGPFAVDNRVNFLRHGIDANASEVTVRIHNTNTKKVIESTFPVKNGEFVWEGSFAIDGVAGSAAPIKLDFMHPAGSRTGKLLPTGNTVDNIDGIKVTLIDVGNPCVFVKAGDFEVPGTISPDDVIAHPTLYGRLEQVRRRAAVMMGLADDLDSTPENVPKMCMISPPQSHTLPYGQQIAEDDVDIMVRSMSVRQPHRALQMTVALAVAAAARTPGSVVAECYKPRTASSGADSGINIAHASGKLMVGAAYDDDGSLRCATVYRTARKLMEGKVFWK